MVSARACPARDGGQGRICLGQTMGYEVKQNLSLWFVVLRILRLAKLVSKPDFPAKGGMLEILVRLGIIQLRNHQTSLVNHM